MNRIILFALAAVLFSTDALAGKGIEVPEGELDVFDTKFKTSLMDKLKDNLPPQYRANARAIQAAIECGLTCFDTGNSCSNFQSAVGKCIKSTFKKLVGNRKMVSPSRLMGGKRWFVPCIKETGIMKATECTNCLKTCSKAKPKK